MFNSKAIIQLFIICIHPDCYFFFFLHPLPFQTSSSCLIPRWSAPPLARRFTACKPTSARRASTWQWRDTTHCKDGTLSWATSCWAAFAWTMLGKLLLFWLFSATYPDRPGTWLTPWQDMRYSPMLCCKLMGSSDRQVHLCSWTSAVSSPLQGLNFEEDWKLLTILMGMNDICDYCKDKVCLHPSLSPRRGLRSVPSPASSPALLLSRLCSQWTTSSTTWPSRWRCSWTR